jgi:hypothetical protein
MESGVESRRSARIPGRFWVAVEGVDAELAPRQGDISATGMFFETEADVGDVGTVQWVHIASHDRTRTVHVMAYVVRVATLADVHREVRGVALEFMPESDDAAAKLAEFVRYVLENPIGDEAQIAPRVTARAAPPDHDVESVGVSRLSVQTLLLDTDWAVPVGEQVRVEIIARGVRRPIRVEGNAVSVLPAVGPGPKRYRIAVQVTDEVKGPLKRFSSSMELSAVDPKAIMPKPKTVPPPNAGPLEPLLSALIQPPAEPPERKHLAGLLSRIPFTTLCSLLELERLSGELTVRRDGVVRLFVEEGRFVDVEPAPNGPRAEIAKLIGCREGTFDFVVADTIRKDKIGQTMTQLLLDLARESDELRTTED